MTEVWKSNPRYYCQFCKCWLADNKPSRDFHEKGKRHQENKEKKINELRKKGVTDAKKAQKMSDSMAAMEKGALKAQEDDLKANPSFASLYGIQSTTTDVNTTPRQIGPCSFPENNFSDVKTTSKQIGPSSFPEKKKTVTQIGPSSFPEQKQTMTHQERQVVHDTIELEKARLSEKLTRHMMKLQEQDALKKEENLKKREDKLKRREEKIKRKEKKLKILKKVKKDKKLDKPKISCHWKKLLSDDGYEYYWNEKNGEVTWDKPEDYIDESALPIKSPQIESPQIDDDSPKHHNDEDGDVSESEAVSKSEEVSESKSEKVKQEWEKVQSSDGLFYFYNSSTEEVTWEKPSSYIDDDEQAENSSKLESTLKINNSNQKKNNENEEVQEDNSKKKPEWEEFESPDGHIYYYNASTEESTWTKPDTFVELKSKEPNEKLDDRSSKKEKESNSSDEEENDSSDSDSDISSDDEDEIENDENTKHPEEDSGSSASSPSPIVSDNEEEEKYKTFKAAIEENSNIVPQSIPIPPGSFQTHHISKKEEIYGGWETIEEPVEEPLTDLQLPPAKVAETKTIFVEKSKLKFHEKKVTSLGGEFVPFKKLKVTKKQFNFRKKDDSV